MADLTPLAMEWGLKKVPRHVGIIMDGNGRWAQSRGLGRSAGHRAGVETLRDIVRASSDVGMEVLSLYAFSTENWKRPPAEIRILMELLVEFLSREIDELCANQVRIRFMGETTAISGRVTRAVEEALRRTEKNTGLVMNIALNYGSRAEIVRAARLLAEDVARGALSPDSIDEAAFTAKLYTAGLPDLDLVVRTSGEQRLSNFMLWQCSYAEFIAPEVFWPDFNLDAFKKVLLAYQSRDRRFGGVNP
jgi:undecaprenyl diphosphate synthase